MHPTTSLTSATGNARMPLDSRSAQVAIQEIKRFAPVVFEDNTRWTGAFEFLPDEVCTGVVLGLVPSDEFTWHAFDVTPCMVSCAPILTAIAAFG